MWDVMSKILFHMELIEVESVNEHKQYNALYGRTPGLILRCLERWFGPGKVAILETGFVSLETAEGF